MRAKALAVESEEHKNTHHVRNGQLLLLALEHISFLLLVTPDTPLGKSLLNSEIS